MPDRNDFIAIFKAEAEERLNKLNAGLVELEKKPDDLELLKELNREAHTLKGAARVMGYDPIQDVMHCIEDIFEKIAQRKIAFHAKLADKVFQGLDIVKAMIEKIARGESFGDDASQICAQLAESCGAGSQGPGMWPSQAAAAAVTGSEEVGGGTGKQAAVTDEYIRVPLSRVNKLLNLIGEMVINKMDSSGKIVQVKKLYKEAKEAQKSVFELGEKIKEAFLLEDVGIANLFSQCQADIQKLKEDILSLCDYISNELFRFDPVIDELQSKMKEMRMLPCGTVFDGFSRMVRDIANQEHKEVRLEISGQETEMDRKVLEGIKTPLMHLLRNCIDHGIEDPAARQALGKSAEGLIRLGAYHEVGNIVILIEDDGRGIDIQEVKATALRKRLVTEKELGAMTDKEIMNLIFMNGYSTSPIITDVSGRGIGLDVVRRDIEKLKGQIVLESVKDKGARFCLLLPLTIAVIRVLLVQAEGTVFAIPLLAIEATLRVPKKEISTIEGEMVIQAQGRAVPLVFLDEALGLPALQDKAQKIEDFASQEDILVVVVSSLDKWVGFIVDGVFSEEEVFLKSLGDYLGKVRNVAGAAIRGRGEVIIILDMTELVDQSHLGHPALFRRRPLTQEKKEKNILIVEDALTTRELEKSILESHGYRVQTAVDGMDALDKVAVNRYDLIVSDIQMPRMDGFEFCRRVRQGQECRDVPIVMVTSLDKEEDKRRGIEVGAQAYIVKGGFDQKNLLDAIERLIGA